MKKIFVPTDFSICAEKALDTAFEIATKTEAAIHLFHTLDTPTHWAKLSVEEEKHFPETKASIQEAKSKLQQIVAALNSQNVEAYWSIYYNLNLVEALNTAACKDSDLIVMGTHGTGTLGRMLLGSNAQKVVRLAKCPVLTVNENAEAFNLKHIIVASSFEEGDSAQKATLNTVRELAVCFRAKVTLLKVEGVIPSKESYEIGEWATLSDVSRLTKASISIDPFSTVDEGIVKYADDVEADMIVLMTHGRKGLSRFIMGSVAETVVNFSPIPVMVTHSTISSEEAFSQIAEGLAATR